MADKTIKQTKATKFKVTQRDIFTRSERVQFMRSIESLQELIMCRLGFYGGLRVSEIVKLCPQDIIVEDIGISPVLHIKESKGGKSRHACIDEATVQLLIAYANENKMNPSTRFLDVSTRTLQRWFESIVQRSGIVRINPTCHTMRHTNITMLLDRGMEIEKVMDHAGHEDISTTMIYTHLTYHTTAKRYNEIVGE